MVCEPATAPDADVYCGDAFDLVEKIPAGSVDLIITSPPYWAQRTYDHDHNWDIRQAWERAGGTLAEVPAYEWYRAHGGVLVWNSLSSPPYRLRNNRFGARRARGPSRSRTEQSAGSPPG